MTEGTPQLRHVYAHPFMDSGRWEGFEHRPGDVYICTSYKAGTTWMQMICAQLILQTPELDQTLTSLSPWLEMRLNPLEEVRAAFAAQTHRRFIKTHTPLDGIPYWDDVTYLYCGRDPRDVFMSLTNHLANNDIEQVMKLAGERGIEFSEPPPIPEDPNELFRMWLTVPMFEWEEDGFPYWSHFNHGKSFWDYRHLPNIHFFHYADLQADLEGEMRRLAGLLEIEVDEARWPALVEAATFESMKRNADQLAPEVNNSAWLSNARFFHKGTSGQWADVLSADNIAPRPSRSPAKRFPPRLHHHGESLGVLLHQLARIPRELLRRGRHQARCARNRIEPLDLDRLQHGAEVRRLVVVAGLMAHERDVVVEGLEAVVGPRLGATPVLVASAVRLVRVGRFPHHARGVLELRLFALEDLDLGQKRCHGETLPVEARV
jgi:aryl sulfotransferase